jgi:hypothetical protein
MKKNTLLKKALLTLGFLLISIMGMAQSSQTFSDPTFNGTATNTFTVPAGVTQITVEAYGPGGGGGYGGNSNKYGGGGGGGGAYTINTTVPVTPGNSYTITIGNAGSGGTSVTQNGGNATATTATFDSSVTVTANGGYGGLSYTNGKTGGGGGTGGTYAGGSGGTGTNSGSGGGGGSAGTTSIGGNGSVPNAGTKGSGGTIAGNGGSGSTSSIATGTNGSNYGGGGGGGTKNSTGGNGAGGYVVITYTATPTITSLGSTSGCVGSSITINGTNLSGVIASNVKIGGTAVASITSNSATQIVAVLGSGTTGTVSVTTAGGTATSVDTFTVNPSPAQPSTIAGNTTPCSGTSQNYSVTDVLGTTYTWTFPSGWTQTAGGTTNSVTVTTNGNSGTITVTPSNGCNGTPQTLSVTPSNVPAQPSTITGSSTPCASSSQIYSVTNVPGTTYTWSFPSGWTVPGTTTNSITVTTNGTSGTISVTPSNSCGTGTARTLAVTISTIPAQPSTITGNTTFCSGTSQVYSVTNVSGTTYTWIFPSGWSQTAGGTSNSVTVTTNGTSGNITVTPSNTCGTGAAQTLAINPNPSPTITGSTPGSRNGTGTVNLSATASSGTLSWFANSTGGSALGTGTSFTTPSISATTSYYVETYNGTCTSSPRVEVVATVIPGAGAIEVRADGIVITDGGAGTPSLTNQTDFNSTNESSGTITKVYTIYNLSSLYDLTIGSFTMGGTNAADFTVTKNPSATVLPLGSTTFEVTFNPTSTTVLGIKTATISFVNNDATQNPFNFNLQGTSTSFPTQQKSVYYENFDNNDGGWVSSGTTSSWIYDNTIHRGEGKFWRVTTTSGSYVANAMTYLTSPTISTSGYKNIKIYLDVRYKTNADLDDGMQMQYSLDNGTSWNVLGTDTESWYNAANVNALNGSLANTYGWNSDSSLYLGTPIAAPYSQFIEKSMQSNVLDNAANLKFRVVFASDASTNDAGCAIDNVIIKGDPITTVADPVVGPGSINSNLKLWLKSNVGTSTAVDGTPLATWGDQAYDNNAVGITGNSPVYRNNATRNINYNPAIDFTAASAQVMKGKGGYWSQDYYVVVKTNGTVNYSAAPQVPISGRVAIASFELDGTALGLGSFTARYKNEMVSHSINSVPQAASTSSYGMSYANTTDSYNQETIIYNIKTNSTGTATEIYKNGKKIDNNIGQAVKADKVTLNGALNFSEFQNLQYNLGVGRFTLAGNIGSYLDGRMTEIVSYSSPKSALEQQKIQSYLGIKNGITLHATNSVTANDLCDVNYIDSNGNIIWNTLNNNGYNYDIAGIGRDDSTLLNQKQSKTENPTPDISIGLGDVLDVNTNNPHNFDSDKKFLVWGNNHGTLAAQPAVIVNMSSGITPALTSDVSFISVGRTWKVVETGGNVPTAKVSIPTTMLSATLTPPGDYLMFISSTPNFDPTAEYRIMTVNGSNLETTYDFDGTKYITFGFAPEKTFVRSISFDGSNDYLDAGKVLNLDTTFTVSAWIKRNSTNQTILSKRDNTFTTGYDLSINSAGKAEMSWINGTKQTITSNVAIPSGIWHNVAVSYDGTSAKLYIDGVLNVTKTMSIVPANTQSFLIAAADGVSPTSFFNGNIDEVRVWKVALTDKQLRFVMNQEILSNGIATNGSIIPNAITLNDISSIPWANLSAYYPMSTYTYTNAKDISNNHYTAALRNLTTVDLQTAPLPYESDTNGAWQTATTWKNNAVQDLPNSLSIVDGVTPVNWNIIKTNHNISSTGNKTVLALMVNSNTITASGDSKIEVTNYLKLDGKIDLVGMSQLVQTLNSDLDVTSSGSIERDQQGQANKYNYNYWSSPVSPINSTANNTNYTIAGIMKDGFNATPREITWIAGYDGVAGNASTPMSIAQYWLYKFDNYANAYSNWAKITETSALQVGQGFTMKGSGGTGTQNYTFVGKPNNGLINSNTVASNQLLLTGNPYTSAIDAEAFINNNSGSIDGTLYFWEHYSTNTTHVLKDYQGGYAVKNLVGGVAPVSAGVDFINQTGTSTRGIPNQFIPVGQGFFVNGSTSGGTITFNNNQRAFFKESDAVNSNSMYKIRSKTSKTAALDHWNDNSNDTIQKVTYKKVRLGFNSNNDYHRQVLLGFMNEKATSGMDYGYDGISLDDIPNDMYLLNGENELVIEGDGYFDDNASYPIGVKTDVAGKISFTIDALENFDAQQKVYIYDDVTKTYNEIQKNAFDVIMPVGINNTRFSLRFKDKSLSIGKTLSVEENTKISDIKIAHIQNQNTIVINNNLSDVLVEKVTLFNILGQSVANWSVENQEQQNIQLPIKKMSSGIYVAKIKTSNGEISKKIIIK